jgi:hypothetical protein
MPADGARILARELNYDGVTNFYGLHHAG